MDKANSIQQTSDGGYIIAGETYSDNGDVSGNHGNYDYWIVKLDSLGVLQWQKCLGGSAEDKAESIQQTTDGGYIIAGYTTSNDGDVSGNRGNYDYWIVKLDSLGVLQWQKCLGGTSGELANSIEQTNDAGYIIAGYTVSNDGDVSGNHGSADCWIVKLDSLGALQWQKCLGGSSSDRASSIHQVTNGGYIIVGRTYSNDGDVSGNNGGWDYWIVKIDSLGTIQWQKCMGGSSSDHAYSIQQTSDTGYIIAGYSNSNDGDVSGNHGNHDYWIVKIDSLGVLQWQKCLGGSEGETSQSIKQTTDAGYIITGGTYSNNGDVSGSNGSTDYWIVKIDSLGILQWQKCLGGSFTDYAYSIQQTTDAGFIIAGYSNSNDGDVSGNHGNYDYWVVKLHEAVLSNQSIEFDMGWNMMSFYVAPAYMDLMNIVQPLMTSGELIKVIDESGNFIQDIPGTGWMNTIGDMANTEGYYIKVTQNTQLDLTGILADTPFEVGLVTGWNMMGYPLRDTNNAIIMLQPLIDSSYLTKAINEAGGIVQYIPGAGWVNTIGDFKPGEGYYNNVTTNCTLTLGIEVPTVTTDNTTNITQTTATSGGDVTYDGGAPVTARGVCWSTSTNPTLADSYTTDGIGEGTFVSNITGLNANNQYYVRAYATNSKGTMYGDEKSFVTLTVCNGMVSFVYEGQTYNTVEIGNQCWMEENLNVGTRIDGVANSTDNGIVEKYCFDDNNANCDIYGGLYQWDEMMQYITTEGAQGICPIGWHSPTDNEWKTMEMHLGMTQAQANATGLRGTDEGGKLKEQGTTHWTSPNTGATNSSGFTALPGGFRGSNGSFGWSGSYGYLWSSTETSGTGAWRRVLMNNYAQVYLDSYPKDNGFSVRCLKDIGIDPPTVTTDNTTNITQTTATSGGNVTYDGGDPVTARGVCWSTSTNPTLADSYTTDGTGEGVFVSNITGLTLGTQYYVCAYATNSKGTSYGNEESFTTLFPCAGITSFVYEGQTYNTVEIGSQCWMEENLNVGTRIDGVVNQTDNGTIEKYCYDNDNNNCDTYGGLYQWDEIMLYTTTQGAQGICPTGWHLPTDNEWKTMEMYLGMTQSQAGATGSRGTDEGVKMKSTSGWNNNGNGTNSSGFNALPGGGSYNGTFITLGNYGRWWSSSEYSGTYAWYRGLWCNSGKVNRYSNEKTIGFSVRCLKN